jgi:hypothetical protein
MPITDEEFDAGEFRDRVAAPQVEPVGEYETEKNLITAFLGENVGSAFTVREVVRGVDFGETAVAETVTGKLKNVVPKAVDAAGDVTASAMVYRDAEEALSALQQAGVVERATVDRDGEPVTYYRISE